MQHHAPRGSRASRAAAPPRCIASQRLQSSSKFSHSGARCGHLTRTHYSQLQTGSGARALQQRGGSSYTTAAASASASASAGGSPESGVASDAASDGTHRSVGPPTIEETSQPSDSALAAATGPGYENGDGNGATHDSSSFEASSEEAGDEEGDDDSGKRRRCRL